MAGILIGIALNIIVFVSVYLLLKRRVDRALSGAEVIDRMRDEVTGMVVELNQTAERNIGLIEERIRKLQSLVGDADRRIQLLRRESDRHEVGSRVYEQLKGSSPRGRPVNAVPEAPAQEANILPTPDPDVTDRREATPESTADSVWALHRQGIEPRLIATRLGTSVDEVELIISLGGRQR